MRAKAWFAFWLVILASSGCSAGREETGGGAARKRVDDQGRVVLTVEERGTLGLETEVARAGSLTTSVLRFGKVVARSQEEALVVAPVTGRLVEPKLGLGARVSSGDEVAVLEPLVDTGSRASLEAQIRELQGRIEGAEAQAAAKRSDLKRVETLVASGLATEADRAQAQATLDSEKALVESLRRASAELSQMTVGRLALHAPVSGVVASLLMDTGSLVQQGVVVARIVQSGPRWIDIAVPPGDPVGNSYRAQGNTEYVRATLLTRGAVIQEDGTRRDRLEAPAEAAPELPPGATVPVDVLHETRGVIVPLGALIRRGLDVVLFVEVDDGRFEARHVTVAATDDALVAVSSGVSAGEHVATRGASALLGELGTTAGQP